MADSGDGAENGRNCKYSSEIPVLLTFRNEFFLLCLTMNNILTTFFFCLPDIVITLRNYPRGESSRDVTVLNIVRLVLQTEFSDVRFESPLIYNNLIAPDVTTRQTAISRPEVAGPSSSERSNQPETSTETASKISDNDERAGPVPQISATVEDSEVEPARLSRKRRRKRKHMAAARYFDSSSENERQYRPLKRRRKHKHSVLTRDSERPGCSRTRNEPAGRKRMYHKGQPRKGRKNGSKHADATNEDGEEETLTGLLRTRRHAYKRPAQHEGSPSKEPVPGPSGRNTGSLTNKDKYFQFNAKPPGRDSKASAKEPLTRRKKRKRRRPRRDARNRTTQPGTSTTDSEEERRPKLLRKRKKKERR